MLTVLWKFQPPSSLPPLLLFSSPSLPLSLTTLSLSLSLFLLSSSFPLLSHPHFLHLLFFLFFSFPFLLLVFNSPLFFFPPQFLIGPILLLLLEKNRWLFCQDLVGFFFFFPSFFSVISKKINILLLVLSAFGYFLFLFLYRWLNCSVHGSTALDNTHPPTTTTTVACFQLPLRLVAPPISAVFLSSRCLRSTVFSSRPLYQ